MTNDIQKHGENAFFHLNEARKDLIKAENIFGKDGSVNIDCAAMKNIRMTVQHCQDMLTELERTRFRAAKQNKQV